MALSQTGKEKSTPKPNCIIAVAKTKIQLSTYMATTTSLHQQGSGRRRNVFWNRRTPLNKLYLPPRPAVEYLLRCRKPVSV